MAHETKKTDWGKRIALRKHIREETDPTKKQAFLEEKGGFGRLTRGQRIDLANLRALGTIQEMPTEAAISPVREEQKGVMREFMDIYRQGGLTPADRARLQQIQDITGQQARGRRGALEEQFMARGQFGGGSQLALQQMANQAALTAASQYGGDVAGRAEQRALSALSQTGGLAGQISGAEELISRFNIQTEMTKQQLISQGYSDQAAQEIAEREANQKMWGNILKTTAGFAAAIPTGGLSLAPALGSLGGGQTSFGLPAGPDFTAGFSGLGLP